MSESTVLVTQRGPVRTLTLNRPASLNSFTGEMHDRLLSELNAAADDPGVRCVVLTGAGRAFCAGQDLADPAVAVDPKAEGAAKDLGAMIERYYRPLALRLHSMPVPVVAAINGVAAGAGANLALNCDVALAARSAVLIQAFAKIGLIPDTGGTWLLPRLVGRAHALGLSLLGGKLPAAEAERLGLIWQCVDDETLQVQAQTLAERLSEMPTKALVATRNALDAAQLLDFDAALLQEQRLQRELGFSGDYREGVSAFTEKRSPRFTDR
ncbi:enoyl-CoA hydratase-related protein [Methylibium sp.]|uniref:enoyl-CoA hydratase-related protein n=1 Tax=Methylibium sp. TaxID=2067992 RepID=UPI003D10505E